MATHRSYPVSAILPKDMLSRLKRRGFKTLEIELIQTKELAMEYLDLDNDWFGRQADPGSID